MNRQEFMRRLEYLLRDIPESERADALAYYNNYFDEAGTENEYQVIQELGSPESVAQTILEDVHRESGQRANQKKGMSTSTKVLIAVVVILTFPLWIGVVAGLFGGLVGLVVGLFGIFIGVIGATFGLVVGGIGCIIGGIMCLMVQPIEGLTCIGIGALLTAIGIVLALLCILIVGVWIPKLIKTLVNWIKGLFHRDEGGNEI